MRSVQDKQKRVKETRTHRTSEGIEQGSDKYERQLHDMRKNSCDKLLTLLRNDNDDFHSWLFSGVRTPEEVADWALSNDCCGYELLKRYLKEADLLICNYNHFLDEDIRPNVLGWMEKELKDIIAIFDEAHNLESSARSHSSLTLSELTINRALDEVRANKDTLRSEDIETFLRVLLDTLGSTYNLILDKKFGERERIGKTGMTLGSLTRKNAWICSGQSSSKRLRGAGLKR